MTLLKNESYPIGELAKRAGVTTRTVRYYCSEGLLPPPVTAGRYAAYGEEHLCRLRLIARLKRRYLPLHEIKARLAAMTTEEIEAQLAKEPEETPAISKEEEVSCPPEANSTSQLQTDLPASLAHFVEETLSLSSDLPAQTLPRRRRVLLISPMLSPTTGRFSEREETSDIAGGYIVDEALGETWKRIPLAPGVELHFRIPDSPEARDALNRVIAQTQDAFKLLR